MTSKNLMNNPMFWGILASLILNVGPAIEKAKKDKQLPTEALFTIVVSVGVAINTVLQMYNSSGSVYYTPKSVPGRNIEDADLSVQQSTLDNTPSDGNF